jgi:hypothetical protein
MGGDLIGQRNIANLNHVIDQKGRVGARYHG